MMASFFQTNTSVHSTQSIAAAAAGKKNCIRSCETKKTDGHGIEGGGVEVKIK